MPIDRFYLEDIPEAGQRVALSGEEFHHLSRVMRKKEGDVVALINGKGLLARATFLSLEKRDATLIIDSVTSQKPLVPPMILIQALPKLSHLEWILQKGTELGASAFHLFPSARSEKTSLSDTQQKRLRLILIGAMKQCGRLDLPTLHFASHLKNLSLPKGNAFFGDLRASQPLTKKEPPYLIFIGPEKGFTEEEHQLLERHFGAEGIRLHPYTLRAETAAIAALTLASQSLQHA